MKILVLFGQRKPLGGSEYSVEALACLDEYGHDENPAYLNGEYEKADKSGEFLALRIITLIVPENDIAKQLVPPYQEVPARVSQ